MSDEPQNPGASVLAVENPHTDDVERAWSKVDHLDYENSLSDDEVARMVSKVDRAKADLDGSRQSLADARQAKSDRAAALRTARSELAEVEVANPELAEAARSRRRLAHDRDLLEARAHLARLEGKA